MNSSSSSHKPYRSNKHRILLVDDDADIVEVLRRGLVLKGILVDGYSFPHEVLKSFKANMYDLAILDIRIPVLSGFQLYRDEKADPAITVSTSFLLLKHTQMSSKKCFLLYE